MTPGTAQAFVYYRVRAADATLAIVAATAFQAELRLSMPGVIATLSRRVDDDRETATLMETYRGADDARQRAIEQQANDALARWLVGPRHVEVFAPCA